MWDAQRPALRRFDIVVVEHPGHGGAPVVAVDDVRDLARRALERVNAKPFVFVGLSLGGTVGMRIALDAPGRLEKLVLASTAARFGELEQWRERAATVRRDGLGAIVDAVLARWFTPAFADVTRFREMFLSTDREGYARCCDALAGWDVRDDVARIGVPTLVVAAADDPSTPPADLELLADRIPGARLKTIEHARHLSNVERPELFNALLLEFL